MLAKMESNLEDKERANDLAWDLLPRRGGRQNGSTGVGSARWQKTWCYHQEALSGSGGWPALVQPRQVKQGYEVIKAVGYYRG